MLNDGMSLSSSRHSLSSISSSSSSDSDHPHPHSPSNNIEHEYVAAIRRYERQAAKQAQRKAVRRGIGKRREAFGFGTGIADRFDADILDPKELLDPPKLALSCAR